MPRFAFKVQRGKFSDLPPVKTELESSEAAWRAGMDMCADLVRGIVDSLTPTDPEWVVTIENDAGETIFRFRIMGEVVTRH
jgi:hypothetical protein